MKYLSKRKFGMWNLITIQIFIMQLGVTSACNSYMDFCDGIKDNTFVDDSIESVNMTSVYDNVGKSNKNDYVEDILNRAVRSFKPYRSEKALSLQITTILDELLFESGYDRQIRPQIEGPPLEIEINIQIRSMGPVDEVSQTFTMDCYFRQYWQDFRLKFNNRGLVELPMNWQFLTKIWRPDTVFINGKNSYLHKMTVPNRFIRISPNGRISYSQRLTVKARCQMDLRKFPLDSQLCPLEIGSFGHDASQMIYRWSKKPLSWDNREKMGLAQYHMVDWGYGTTLDISRRTGNPLNMSSVYLEFTFKRRMGFFVLQIYIPLALIVCCSWVTFWLVKTEKGTEIPARTSLGATTVLSVVTIGFGGKSKPQVGYATALDVFIIMCFGIVFAALIEFACINFIDTLIRRIKKKEKERMRLKAMLGSKDGNSITNSRLNVDVQEDDLMDDGLGGDGLGDDDGLSATGSSNLPSPTPRKSFTDIKREFFANQWNTVETTVTYGNGTNQIMTHSLANITPVDIDEGDVSCSERLWNRIESCFLSLTCSRSFKRSNVYRNTITYFNTVDRWASRIFPLMFVTAIFIYWSSYTYIL